MKFAVLFSGGKDSIYSLWYYFNQGWIPQYLVSIFSENPESYMYHVPNIQLTKLSSEALGIPLIFGATKGKKEEEVEDLKNTLSKIKNKIDAVVSGALLSDYQTTRIEKICHELSLKSFAPLWGKNQQIFLKELVDSGFEVIITAVAGAGLDKSWLGREIGRNALKDLKKLHERYSINVAGEGGEYETLVLDGPLFKKKIKLIESEKIWQKNFGYLKIKKATLLGKEKSEFS